MHKARTSVPLLSAVAVIAACAVETDPDIGTTRESVLNGTVDTTHKTVGRLDSGCTGFLVCKNVFMTASHCGEPSSFTTEGVTSSVIKGERKQVVTFDWLGNDLTAGEPRNDIGIWCVDHDYVEEVGKTDEAWTQSISGNTLTAGTQGTVVGYGRSPTMPVFSDPERRRGTMVYEQTMTTGTYTGTRKFLPSNASDPSSKQNACEGDSGGPIFVSGDVAGIVHDGPSSGGGVFNEAEECRTVLHVFFAFAKAWMEAKRDQYCAPDFCNPSES